MKPLIAFISSLLLLFHLTGYQLVYALRLSAVKTEMKHKMAHGHLRDAIRFSFGRKELRNVHWMEHGKEFRYCGKYYDVVRTQKEQGRLVVYCIADDEETFLSDALRQTAENRTKNRPMQEGARLLLVQFIPAGALQIKGPVAPARAYYSNFSFSLLSLTLSVPVPPPEAC